MSFRFDLDRIDRRQLVPGLILIGIGVLGLFGSLGLFRGFGGFLGAILFGAAAYFAYLQGRHTGRLLWQAAAFPLAGLAIASVAPGNLGGFAFLGSIGAAFWLAWRDDARRWWALIPAGVLASLAVTALVDGATRGAAAGGFVFLGGLALTFFALTRLPQHAQSWAIFPAGALAVLAVLALTTSGGWIVPLVLIAAGAWMLLRPNAAGAAAPRSGPPVPRPTATVPAERPATAAPAAPMAPTAPEAGNAAQPAAAASATGAPPSEVDAGDPANPDAPLRPADDVDPR
jgi:hypothetical protein